MLQWIARPRALLSTVRVQFLLYVAVPCPGFSLCFPLQSSKLHGHFPCNATTNRAKHGSLDERCLQPKCLLNCIHSRLFEVRNSLLRRFGSQHWRRAASHPKHLQRLFARINVCAWQAPAQTSYIPSIDLPTDTFSVVIAASMSEVRPLGMVLAHHVLHVATSQFFLSCPSLYRFAMLWFLPRAVMSVCFVCAIASRVLTCCRTIGSLKSSCLMHRSNIRLDSQLQVMQNQFY